MNNSFIKLEIGRMTEESSSDEYRNVKQMWKVSVKSTAAH